MPRQIVTGSNQLRVCVVSSGLGHVARGIEAWAADLGAALAARGVHVALCKGGGECQADYERVLPCWQRESEKTRRLLQCLPRWFFWRLGLASGYDIEQLTFARSLVRCLRREPADVVHVQDPRVAIILHRVGERGRIHARTILAHGTEEPLEFQERITYLQHLAPWHLEEAKAAGVWKPTWTAIPNFIDTERFRPGPTPPLRRELAIPDDGLVVLSVAAIKRHHKRVDHLVNEFAQLRRRAPGLPVWLVVAGGWEKETDQLAADGERLLFSSGIPRLRWWPGVSSSKCPVAPARRLISLRPLGTTES